MHLHDFLHVRSVAAGQHPGDGDAVRPRKGEYFFVAEKQIPVGGLFGFTFSFLFA